MYPLAGADRPALLPDGAGLDLAARSRLAAEERLLLRKEVIQPQVPLRLPCYDFIPVTGHTLGTFLPCGLVQ
jgi:hypothetical protein